MVHVVESEADFRTQLRDPKRLVVCYFGAEWCGPCKMYGPQFEALAQQHGAEAHFIKVWDTLSEVVSSEGVRAYPTTKLYLDGDAKGDVVGAGASQVAQRIEELKASMFRAFQGGGASLGGTGAALSPEEAREARLRRFQVTPTTKKESPAMEVCGPDGCGPSEEDAELQAALQMSMEAEAAPTPAVEPAPAAEEDAAAMDVEATTTDADADADAPDTELTEGVGAQLLEMGFLPLRSRKALRSVGAGAELDACMNWLMEHQDDADIDDEATLPPKPAAARELTSEERAEKMELVQRRMAERRREREEAEKVAKVQREADRRKTGKETVMRREEMERMARRREAQKVRKEKEDARKERARILAELEKDKRERASNNGKLNSRLGVDGYKPSGVQYDNPHDDAAAAAGEEAKAAEAPGPARAAGRVSAAEAPDALDRCIDSLKQYRAGGDGGKAIDMLLKIVRKIVENPEDARFRRLNMDANAYKRKIKPFIGGLRLMTAVGFEKKTEDGGQHLVLEDLDSELLTLAQTKLAEGLAAYQGN